MEWQHAGHAVDNEHYICHNISGNKWERIQIKVYVKSSPICQVMDIQETQFEDPAPSKQKRIIHFSSGEILELEDSEEEEEEEQSSSTPPFTEPTERVRHC